MERHIIFIFVILAVIGISFTIIQPTGFLGASGLKQSTLKFSEPDFSYNSSEVEISEGTIRLKSRTVRTEKEISNRTDYIILKALSDTSSDKTEKIKKADDEKVEVNKNKPLYISFAGDLSNGDLVSIGLTSQKDSIIKICDFIYGCGKEYGNLNYNGTTGPYDIAISGMEKPSKDVLLATTEDIKIDMIKTNKYSVERIIIGPDEKTSKILSVDGDSFSLADKKIFYLTFGSEIKTNSTVSLHISSDKDSTIKICSFPSCSTVYGTLDYVKGQQGIYNITLSLDSPINKFVIDSSKTVEIDKISVFLIEKTIETNVKTSYPSSSSVETKETPVINLAYWSSLVYDKRENGQNLTVYYSTGGGWNLLPDGGLLKESTNSTSKKIKFKVNILTDTKNTPEIGNMTLSYITRQPEYNTQSLVSDYASKGSLVNISFNITNPDLVNSVSADITDTSGNIIERVNLNYDETGGVFIGLWNTSKILEGVYIVNLTVKSNYTDLKNLKDVIALMSDVKGSFSSKPSNSSGLFLINAKEKAGAEVSIKAPSADTSVNIIQYTKNIKQTLPTEKEVGKYVEIVPEEKIEGLESVKLKIYYTDQDIALSGIEEKTLSMQYFNETSGIWEKLNSSTNTTGKYVEATTAHFSTYGLFGEQKSSQKTQSSPSSGSSGGGSGTAVWPDPSESPIKESQQIKKSNLIDKKIQPQQTPTLPLQEKPDAQTPIQNKCNYDIEITAPKFLPSGKNEARADIINNGNCDILSLRLSVTDDIKGLVELDPEYFDLIKSGESDIFSIKTTSDSSILLNTINGLSIGVKESGRPVVSGRVLAKGLDKNMNVLEKDAWVMVEYGSGASGKNFTLTELIMLLAVAAVFIGYRVTFRKDL